MFIGAINYSKQLWDGSEMQCQPLTTPWKELGIPACRNRRFLFMTTSATAAITVSPTKANSFKFHVNWEPTKALYVYKISIVDIVTCQIRHIVENWRNFITFWLNLKSRKMACFRLSVSNVYSCYKLLKITLRRKWDAIPTAHFNERNWVYHGGNLYYGGGGERAAGTVHGTVYFLSRV